jgi:cytochrome c peroxidase
MADPVAFAHAFDRSVEAARGGSLLVLSLSSLRGVTTESLNAGGRVTIDLTAGIVTSYAQLLPSEGTFDLWLIDNRPGPSHTTFAEPSDRLIRVGSYFVAWGAHWLFTWLGPSALSGFFPDRAFVVRSGSSPLQSFVLTGSSTLFDRLRHRQVRFVSDEGAALGVDPESPARGRDLATLVADGRQLFLDDTFDGNGRTCGTCHVESNNFTIDPSFIATLPASDPLFVAETNPALAALEHPDLLRRFGLILVNADGFDPPKGSVLRATQNLQALANSMVPQDPSFFIDFSSNGRNPDPPERLGWGNDGAPIRDFALVAIVQHAPKSLGRILGIDFRGATDEELDALAAYQLALGRQEDFDLSRLELKSTLARTGKALYLDSGNLLEPGHKNCNGCHFNGGGTAGMSLNPFTPGFPRQDGSPRGFNFAAATNVNETPLALALGLPRDGGFGQILTVFGSFGNTGDLFPPFGHFELEEFNSPPVVESADTGPFFHNHTIPDLESAVAFYGTPAFQASIVGRKGLGGQQVQISANPDDPEVQAIAAFLRVLNAVENIRSSINVAQRGRKMTNIADMQELAGLSLAEAIDAQEVLSGGSLASALEPAILSARVRLLAARMALEAAQEARGSRAIDLLMDEAIRNLRGARSNLANPTSLPKSFRN